MAILVDELREYPDVELPFTVWCHMATDGAFAELHAFAARLGLRRAWFQRDHYDLPAHARAAAVALGAEEVATGELLVRMTGARGERARRRAFAPAGVSWLQGPAGPVVLRFPPGALVVIGGPSGVGKSALAARVVGDRLPLHDAAGEALPAAWRERLAAALSAGAGAVAVTRALRHGHRVELAGLAVAAGVPAHLVLLDAAPEAGRAAQVPDDRFEQPPRAWEALRRALRERPDAAPFESVTVLDRDAADRLRRIAVSPST